jgi:hypothetical protein
MTPRQKTRRDRRRARPLGRPGRQRQRTVEEIDRDLAEKIAAWAKTWEVCVDAGCRRNARCLHQQDCRMHTERPWTEEDRASVREWLDRMPIDPEPTYDRVKGR